jgi:Glycosyl hydrolases family 25
MTIWLCDWTEYQGPINAPQIEAEGFSGVWLKSSGSIKHGGTYVDQVFQLNAAEVLKTSLIPGAFHYLMPGNAGAQAGLFSDMIRSVAYNALGIPTLRGWLCKLDVEQPGLTRADIVRFINVWNQIENGYPLWIYTSRSFWLANNLGAGSPLAPLLEEAHWVAANIRDNPEKPYASQHYKAVDPLWWNVAYAGWNVATMMQFTNKALVAGLRTTASAYPGSKKDLLAVGTW